MIKKSENTCIVNFNLNNNKIATVRMQNNYFFSCLIKLIIKYITKKKLFFFSIYIFFLS